MATTYKVTAERAFEIFRIIGALLRDGHFVFTEGAHSADYLNLRKAYAFPLLNSELALGIAERMLDWGVQTVAGLPHGAVGLTELVAMHLSILTGSEVNAIYLIKDERNPKALILPPWTPVFVEGRTLGVIDDTISSGGTVRKGVNLLTAAGGNVVGASSIASRGLVSATSLGLQVFTSIVEADYPVWTAEECATSQLCAKGVPIRTDVGHGREFLARLAIAGA